MPTTSARHEVLVVGGGPAGAATAYWLAEAGHDVLVVEKKTFPREKTCGDGLTPRAVRQLARHGPRRTSRGLPPLRRAARRRPRHHARAEWPEHPDLPVARVRRSPARPRPAGRRERGEVGSDRLGGRRSDRADHRPRARRAARSSDGRRAESARPTTSSSPTARTLASVARSARRATVRTRRAWRSAATSRARCTPTRGSRRALDVKRSQRQRAARLRMDLPGRRRLRERRHRTALDVPRLPQS